MSTWNEYYAITCMWKIWKGS